MDVGFFCCALSGIYVEKDPLILQELALDVRSTVAKSDKSWDCDIYNIICFYG